MNRSERVDRVWSVVQAARTIANPTTNAGAQLRIALQATSGLSAEGIELALSEHLELHPSAREVDALVDSVEPAPRVQVVLSANVFVGALRAIALAAASAPQVIVRPSSREPHFAESLVQAILDPAVFVALTPDLRVSSGDEVHVYGRDQTIADVCSSLPSDVWVRGHGTGFGIAVVDRKVDRLEASRLIARDVVAFDQRGCLSPRMVIHHGSIPETESLAEAIGQELLQWQTRVPRGPVTEQDAVELARFQQTAWAIGKVVQPGDSCLAVSPPLLATYLPPVGRHLILIACESEGEARAAIAPSARHITAIGHAGGAIGILLQQALAGARSSPLGQMQRPLFDGPVDRRHPHRERPEDVIKRLG